MYVGIKCEVVLSTLKKEIKEEASKLKKDGLAVEKVWIAAYNLVPNNGWKNLDKRLKKLFQMTPVLLMSLEERLLVFFMLAKG